MRSRCYFGIILLFLSACGTRVPSVEEAWEPVDVSGDLEFKIRQKIFCETVDAIREARKVSFQETPRSPVTPALPDSYGVQVQTTITVDENTAFNPTVGPFNTLSSAKVAGVSVPRSIATNLTGTVSSTATRVGTSYSYYNVMRIAGKDKDGKDVNSWCNDPQIIGSLNGSSFLLVSDLGIRDYLVKAVRTSALLHSSPKADGGAGKTAKIDIFSYEVKFVVVTSGGINPVVKLANIATGFGNQPLLTMGRTRTHALTLTFGPGTDQPFLAALQAHFNGQLVQSLRPTGQ